MLTGACVNRIILTRLKVRYPDKKQKIEDHNWGEAGYKKLWSPIIPRESVAPFVEGAPDAAQMLDECGYAAHCARFWGGRLSLLISCLAFMVYVFLSR